MNYKIGDIVYLKPKSGNGFIFLGIDNSLKIVKDIKEYYGIDIEIGIFAPRPIKVINDHVVEIIMKNVELFE